MGNEKQKQVFSDNLKFYLKKNRKKRVDMCRELDISYTTLTDWYHGVTYPRIDKIEMLAEYFGISKSELIEERKDR